MLLIMIISLPESLTKDCATGCPWTTLASPQPTAAREPGKQTQEA